MKINKLPDTCPLCGGTKKEGKTTFTWSYALLGENTFYSMNAKGASIEEILEYSKLTKQRVEGILF